VAFWRALRRWWWTAVVAPMLGLVAAVVVLHRSGSAELRRLDTGSHWFYWLCSMVSTQVILACLLVVVLERRSRQTVPRTRGDDPHRAGRRRAVELAADGADGLVRADGADPELSDLGDVWYASPGRIGRVRRRRWGRLSLPPVDVAADVCSWLELEAGADLHVSITAARHDDRPDWWVERLVAPVRRDVPSMPSRVAELAPGVAWPHPDDPLAQVRSTRRRGAVAIAVVGIVDVVSALTPPLRNRLSLVRRLIPMHTPAAAAGLVAAGGLGLVVLAAGLARGRRAAWTLACALLAVSAVGHVVKGFDLEEATLSGMLGVWLLTNRRCFTARSRGRGVRAVALRAGAVLGLVEVAAAAWVWAATTQSAARSLVVVAARSIALPVGRLPHHGRLLTTALPALVLAAAVIVARSIVGAQRPPVDDPDTTARAWAIVREHGAGTLDYFALRDDKQHLVVEDTVIAYTVVNGTAVVSPDPIGPADQRWRAWSAFRQFAAEQGWRTAALGAGASWLPIYEASGMWALYIGDESIVDVRRFTLEGGRNKSLRQAVNRVARAGYTVEFHDPTAVPPELRRELLALATQSRQGAAERGFSMTLSRLFDPRDSGLLLALARDGEGRPAAFCQFVPAPGIGGYSLDLMRRGDAARADGRAEDAAADDAPRHPNGLTEFVVVRTIEHLREQGMRGLGLHFATMRALLAGEVGDRLWHRLLADVMHRLSDDMQIESLWRFNSKFDPSWQPRYVLLDRPRSALVSGLAIARVESLWELPVLGRLLRPDVDPFAEVSPVVNPS
jgi:lysylphosphatidylglycerol synthetase-like protein (DUF2156 family)